MDTNTIFRVILIGLAVFVAVKILLYVMSAVLGLLQFALVIAIIVGVAWLLMNLFGKKGRAF